MQLFRKISNRFNSPRDRHHRHELQVILQNILYFCQTCGALIFIEVNHTLIE